MGYLVASETTLYVPSGRAMPAAFDKKDGTFLHFCELSSGKYGGVWTMLAGNSLLAGVDNLGVSTKVALDEKTGESVDDVHSWISGHDLVYSDQYSFTLTKEGIYAVDREEFKKIQVEREALKQRFQDRQDHFRSLRRKLYRGEYAEKSGEGPSRSALMDSVNIAADSLYVLKEQEEHLKSSLFKWKYDKTKLNILIQAGNLIVAGGEGFVIAIDAELGEELWTGEVEDNVQGLAATGGKLFVSTDQGQIYCFFSCFKSATQNNSE